MVVNEEEFRTFIANLNVFVNNSRMVEAPSVDDGSYFITYCRIKTQLGYYIDVLQKDKNSKWKQLKIEGYEEGNKDSGI